LAETKAHNHRNTFTVGAPVLVAVDFSADSKAALVWACSHAGLTGGELVVLHVVHDPGEAPGDYRHGEKDVLRPMEDVAREMLKKFVRKVQREYPEVADIGKLKTKLVRGIPASRILEVAEAVRAGQIVMGSRGRTGLPHLMLGSKAERVVQMSPIPVTVVKAESNET